MEKPNVRFWISEESVKAGGDFKSPRQGDAGFDLKSVENIKLAPGEQTAVRTGLHLAIPLGWVGIVKDRSSMASKGIYTHGGVIDAAYRGEVKILVSNRSTSEVQIGQGDKVAQLVVVAHLEVADRCADLESLGNTERGAGGFGSTGK